MGLDQDIRQEATAFKDLAGEFKKRAQGEEGRTPITVGDSDEEREKILAILKALNDYLAYKMPEAGKSDA